LLFGSVDQACDLDGDLAQNLKDAADSNAPGICHRLLNTMQLFI